VLYQYGALRHGHVREVVVESSRPTLLSRIIRLRLEYEGDARDAPLSVIFKTGLPERLSDSWTGGRQEVAFYTQVADWYPERRRIDPECASGPSSVR